MFNLVCPTQTFNQLVELVNEFQKVLNIFSFRKAEDDDENCEEMLQRVLILQESIQEIRLYASLQLRLMSGSYLEQNAGNPEAGSSDQLQIIPESHFKVFWLLFESIRR